MRPSLTVLAALALLLSMPLGRASAQASVSVLGLTSLEGDDEFARNFTGALRQAATQVDGWTVSDRDVALTQMELTHDCSSSDTACMTEIASTLGSTRVIYGTIQRAPIGTRYEFQVTLFLFDAETGAVEERITENVPSSDTDIDALRTPARNMVRALSAATSPGVVRVTGGADLEVRIDGAVVGRTDAGGTYVSDALPPGEHVVRLGDAEETVTVAGGETLAGFAILDSGGGGGGGSVLPFIGIGLMGVGAAALIVSFWSMGEINSVNNSGAHNAFLESVGRMPGVTMSSDSCAFADTVAPPYSGCSYGSTMEILQYVMLATGVVAVGAGAALLVVGLGEDSGTTDTAGVRLRLSPSLSPERAYLGATLEF
jgi:hypothetical protein